MEAIGEGVGKPRFRKAFRAGGEGVGGRDLRHVVEELEAGFGDVERRGQVEDGPAVLDRDHPAGGERAAVADPVDLVEHGDRGIPGPQEVGVQRVDGPVLVDGAGRSHQCLAGHLPTEDPLAVLVG